MRERTGSEQVTLVSLVISTVAFVVLEVAGLTDTPPIPPALVAIVACALALVVAPGRWALAASVLTAVVSLAVMVAVGAAVRLVEPRSGLELVCRWVLVPGLVGAAAGGAVGLLRQRGGDGRPRSGSPTVRDGQAGGTIGSPRRRRSHRAPG